MSLAARSKLWIESDGHLIMSDYRVRLLELVDRTGSLSQAAETLSLSYRRAWGKVKELEGNLGMALVRSESGGRGGGRSMLTPEGARLVAAYGAFRQRSQAAVDTAFEELVLPALTGNRAGSRRSFH